jgi:hypothetical protein
MVLHCQSDKFVAGRSVIRWLDAFGVWLVMYGVYCFCYICSSDMLIYLTIIIIL